MNLADECAILLLGEIPIRKSPPGRFVSHDDCGLCDQSRERRLRELHRKITLYLSMGLSSASVARLAKCAESTVREHIRARKEKR